MKLKLIVSGLLLGASSLMASSVMVKDAYVRATPPSVPNSAAFMMIMNKTSDNLEIVGATSNIAKKVQLHQHTMHNGMMKMGQVKKVDLKSKSHVIFKPGGYHIMLLGLNKPLKEGTSVMLTLKLSNGEEVKIHAPVKRVMDGMKHTSDKKMKSHGNM